MIQDVHSIEEPARPAPQPADRTTNGEAGQGIPLDLFWARLDPLDS